MTHTYNWKPIPNECGRYICACTTVGRRERGIIVPYSNNPLVRAKPYPAAARISRFTPDERDLNRADRMADPRWHEPEEIR